MRCSTAGFTIPQIFLFTGLANAVVAFYIFLLVPEYLLRFVAWVLSRFVYRFKVSGDENIPLQGAAVLVCNHVSFVDAVLLMAASPRPIRFLMDHRIFRVPVLGWLFRLAKAIPVAPRSEDPAAYEAAFDAAAQVLREGDLLAIFPEGGITRDGTLQPFKGGIVKILERAQADGLDRAGDPDGADQPVGLVLQPHRAGDGHGAALSPRHVQPRGAECGRAGGAGPGAAGGVADAGRRAAGRRLTPLLGGFRALRAIHHAPISLLRHTRIRRAASPVQVRVPRRGSGCGRDHASQAYGRCEILRKKRLYLS